MPDRGAAYLLITGSGIPETVFTSQVVEPLRELAGSGVVFDLMAYRGLRGATQYRRAEDARAIDVRRALAPGRVWLHTVPLIGSRFGIFIAALLAAVHLWPSVLKGKDCVCHCRGHRAGSAGVWLKRLVPRCEIVFDIRGDISEQATPGTRTYAKLKAREARAVGVACQIMCVSELFRRKIAEEYPAAADKITVIPCVASADLFQYDPSTRREVRHQLGVEDRTVLAYCGGLSAPWQLADSLIAAFCHLHAASPTYHLLLVTPDANLARKLASNAGIEPNDITIASLPLVEVPGRLMAADVGLLLRHRDPVNAVASPTKVAEYLMTGLPVAVSEGIGDIGGLVLSNQFGALIENVSDTDAIRAAVQAAAALPSSDVSRAARAARAASLLSSQRYLPTRLEVYARCRR